MILAKALKEWRENRGLTIEVMANSIGVSRSAYHRFESGRVLRSDAVGRIMMWTIINTDIGTKKP